MFGDGASNTGNFGETMTWRRSGACRSCSWSNNLYGMGTSLERHSAVTELSRKAEGYGVRASASTGWT